MEWERFIGGDGLMFLKARMANLKGNRRLSETEFLQELEDVLDRNKCTYHRQPLMNLKDMYVIVTKEDEKYVAMLTAGFIYGTIEFYGIERLYMRGD